MLRHRVLLTFLLCLPWAPCITARAQTNVLTYHNDNARTGQNTTETILTPATVNTNQFGKLYSVPVDGYVFAQPLVLTNVSISGGTYNVVYVATEHDGLYAIDATNGTVLWQKSFINPGAGITTVTTTDVNCTDITPEIGITGTPVIDSTTSTIYLLARTKENGTFVQRLHAIDAATGSEKFGGPVAITASVAGTGDGSTGSMVAFDPKQENSRTGLLLQNGHIILGWASLCDNAPYHGWVMSYNAGTLAQEAVFNASPNGSDAGIWMSGGALAGDASFNTFFATGNGSYDGTTNYADSILKFSPPTSGSFPIADWFTPDNQATLNSNDADVGAGGVLLLPDLPVGATYQHLLFQVSKLGTMYLVNRDNMGKLCTTCTGADTQIVQEISYFVTAHWGTPAYWNGSIYVGATSYEGGTGDNLKAYSFNANNSGLVSTTPTSHSSESYLFPGGTPSISANGTVNGIVWALENGSFAASCCQVLRAYDATNLATEFYNSDQAANQSDEPGGAVKFSVPTVANGRVYVGSQGRLNIYGLFNSQNATPTFSPAPKTYPTAQSVSISDVSPGTTIYYTTDGSNPSASSPVYSTPISVTATTTIKAIAVGGTLSISAVASGSYTIQSQATPPVLSPAPGPFQNPINVTLLDNSAGVTIYYTTDGSTPTTSSTVYTGPIAVSTTTMINAIASGGGFMTSAVTNGAYVSVSPAVNFAGGFSGAGMTLNGSAAYNGTRLRLTNGGVNEVASAFYSTPVNVQSFTTDFSFQLTNPSSDGFTFTIQGSGLAALGSSGGALGYGGPTNISGSLGIPTSLAVKFDLYNNNGEGNNSTGLYTNGAEPITPALDLTSSGVNLHSGDVFNVHMSYDGTTLAMTITDASYPSQTFSTSWPINIPGTVSGNSAYMGFTAGTGGATATQDILSWMVTPGGIGLAPQSGLSFSGQALGTVSSAQIATLSNAGTTPATISGYSISGGNAGDFSISNNSCPNSPSTLAVASNCPIAITFNPLGPGPRKSTLTITSNTGSSPVSIILSGVGTAVSLLPTSLNFPSQTTGTSSTAQTITLTNKGTSTLNIWQSAVAGANASDFSTTSTCGSTLASSASCTVNVTFTPSAAGARTASWLVSDSGGGSPQSVSLTGSGTAPVAPASATVSSSTGAAQGDVAGPPSLYPSRLTFGPQKVGTASVPQSLVLTNTGKTTLTIHGISISGPVRGEFVQSNTCATTLAKGQHCLLHVTFIPRNIGVRTATIKVVSGTGVSTSEVKLSGTAVGIHSSAEPPPNGSESPRQQRTE